MEKFIDYAVLTAVFLVALRAAEGPAGGELVRRYDPYRRRVNRLRLCDPRLWRPLELVGV